MAENLDFYYPFDSLNGDRVTTAATERRFFNALFADGVVNSGDFAVSVVSGGEYRVGAGVAIIGGAIGGLTAARVVTAKPSAGVTAYIVLRLNTEANARTIDLTVTTAPQTSTSQAQLDEGGVLDLVLYSVQGLTGGGYGLLDQRKYCTTFENKPYAARFTAMLSEMEANGTDELNALTSLYRSAIDEVNAEASGLYGAAGRQGFINPCFMVNQRGKASYGLTSGSAYTYDRWKLIQSGKALAAAMEVTTEQDGQRHALRFETSEFTGTGNVGRTGIAQNIEGGVRTFCAGGRQFTVSFDAKASSVCRLGIDAKQVAQTGGTGVELSRTVDLSEQWKRYSVTFTGSVTPTAEQLQDVLQIGFFATFLGYTRYGADQNGGHIVWLANMQINEGSAALPCYVKPYADELEACQRYYVKLGYVSLAVGATLASLNQVITSPLPITRRLYRMPAATFTDRANVSGKASLEVATGGWRNGLTCAISSNSTDAPVFVVTNTDASAVTRVNFNSLALDAEITD